MAFKKIKKDWIYSNLFLFIKKDMFFSISKLISPNKYVRVKIGGVKMMNDTEMIETVLEAIVVIDGVEKETMLTLAKKIIDKGRVNLQFTADHIDFTDAVVVKFKDTNNVGVSLRYIEDEKIAAASALTLIFDEFSNMLRYQELVVEHTGTDEVSFKYYVENEEIENGTYNTSDDEVMVQLSWASCMKNCLAGQGVPDYVIAIFGTVCASACASVTVCPKCIEGPLLAYAAKIKYCMNKC